jgi:hypothetical protein
MTTVKTITAATFFAAAAIYAGTAAAGEGAQATWTASGNGSFDVTWSAPPARAQHGGGVAYLAGAGDNAVVVYADTIASTQPSMTARLSGSGDNAQLSYTAPAEPPRAMAGEATFLAQQG